MFDVVVSFDIVDVVIVFGIFGFCNLVWYVDLVIWFCNCGFSILVL